MREKLIYTKISIDFYLSTLSFLLKSMVVKLHKYINTLYNIFHMQSRDGMRGVARPKIARRRRRRELGSWNRRRRKRGGGKWTDVEGSWTKERGGGTIVVWIKRRGDRVLRKFRTTRTDESLIEWQKGSRGSWPLTFHCDFAGPVWAHRGLAAGFARFLAFFFFASCVDTGVSHPCAYHGILKCKTLITGGMKEGGLRFWDFLLMFLFIFLIFIVDFFCVANKKGWID